MKYIFILLGLIVTGAGCSPRTQQATPTDRRPAWLIPREGIAIVTEANLESGPPVSFTDGATGRVFSSQLPSIFTDGNGTYTTGNPGERVSVQLSVAGSLKDDRTRFEQQKGLERFEDGELGEWKVTVAYQTTNQRWVARAVKTDPFEKDGVYHVIECLGTEKSDNLFWDGCSTIIERARIDQSRATN